MLDTLLRKPIDWLVGLAITLDIKFRQPALYNWLVAIAFTDDDPFGDDQE